jgi:3-hydroxyisobutyrate dehydrogenase-like beta-hydroxyacid dehydrogenase
MTTQVAILGTGKMGGTIARRLAGAGFDVVLWNRTRERALAVGVGRVVDTPAQAAREASTIITSLTGAEAVRATLERPNDGALSGVTGHPLFIEMSTAGPDVEAEVTATIRAAGAALVDAPIVGAPRVVESGAAAILVGGDASDVERARPVLQTLGEVHHVGPLGSGARLKLVANSYLAALTAAAAELQTAGVAAGLAPNDVFFVLQRLVPALALRRTGYVEGRHEPAQFALRDLRKDVDLALEMFGQSDSRVPITSRVQEIVTKAALQMPASDITGVMLQYAAPARGVTRSEGDAV